MLCEITLMSGMHQSVEWSLMQEERLKKLVLICHNQVKLLTENHKSLQCPMVLVCITACQREITAVSSTVAASTMFLKCKQAPILAKLGNGRHVYMRT